MVYVLVGLVTLDLAIFWQRPVWRSYNPDEYALKLEGCRRLARDLVVVGGSPVSEGIDPRILEGLAWRGQPLQHVYNLGLPGGTAAEVWHALKHGLAAPPRLILHGVTASDFNDNRNEPHGPASLMDLEDVRVWRQLRPQSWEWCVRHFTRHRLGQLWSLFDNRNGIRLWAADQAEQLWPGFCPAATAEAQKTRRQECRLRADHGYAPLENIQGGSLPDLRRTGGADHFIFLAKFQTGGGHFCYLHRELDWAERNGVAVVLVDMPVPADLDERLYPAAFAAYRSALAEVERQRGIRVLRGDRQAIGLCEGDFADLIHLNARGVSKFSDWLRRQLEALGEDGP